MVSALRISGHTHLWRLVAIVTLSASVPGCTFTFQPNAESEAIKVLPVGEVKPELDYSKESPDCEVAALRIGENIQVGMARADVERLVGQPRFVFAGVWYWSRGFARSGLPLVKFKDTNATTVVSSFSSASSVC